MRCAKVYTKTESWETNINGTDEEIKNYFLGNFFDVGVYPIEKMEKVEKVIIYDKKIKDGKIYTL